MIDVTKTWAQLAAAGVTSAIQVRGVKNHTFQVTVAAINTTVDVRAEGSHDGDSYFNLNDSEVDTQYSANGTYDMHKANFTCQYVRFRFVTEAGGTAVTLDVKYIGNRD